MFGLLRYQRTLETNKTTSGPNAATLKPQLADTASEPAATADKNLKEQKSHFGLRLVFPIGRP